MPEDETALVHTVAARLLDLLAETTTLPDLLDGICELTVEVVPGCTTTSLTVIRDGALATVASFDERAEQVDETQYTAGQGPCLEAAGTDRLVLVQDVTDGPSEAWRGTARAAGLRGALSVPVPAGADFSAGLNIYTERPEGWPENSVVVAETLATYVGDALAVAYRLHDQSFRRGGSARPWTTSAARSSSNRSSA